MNIDPCVAIMCMARMRKILPPDAHPDLVFEVHARVYPRLAKGNIVLIRHVHDGMEVSEMEPKDLNDDKK